MTVRDVYIFRDVGDVLADVEDDDPEAEVLDDVRRARRIKRAPLVSERRVRLRERRAVVAETEDADDDAAMESTEEAALNRVAFGGVGALGAALTIIGLLIVVAAWTGPTWGWVGAPIQTGIDAYGFAEPQRVAYPDPADYADSPYDRYARAAFEADEPPLIDPSRAMLVGGVLLFAGVALVAARRRSFLNF